MSEQKLVHATEDEHLLPKQPEVNIGSAGHVDHGKCLDLDEYVLIGGRVRTGRDLLHTIGSGVKVLNRTDGSTVYETPENTVVSLDDNMRLVHSSSSLYVQPYEGLIYDVTTDSGRKISTSPEHPLLVNRKGVILWVKARELVKDDYVTFAIRVPLAENASFPDPMSELSRRYDIVTCDDYLHLVSSTDEFRNLAPVGPTDLDKIRLLSRLSFRALARMAHTDERRVKKILRGETRGKEEVLGRIRESLSYRDKLDLGPGDFVAGVRKGSWSARKFHIPAMGSDLAKWFAFVWAEGTSAESRIAVAQSVQRAMLAEFLDISVREFGVEFRRVSGVDYHHDSRVFVDLLRIKFSYLPGNESVCGIADWVLGISPELRATFLRWFLTLDGEFNAKSGQIMVSQRNEKNIVIIGYLLQSLGITPRFSETKVVLQSGPRTYARLIVSGRQNLARYEKVVGFEDPRIQTKLRSYLARIQPASKESDFVIPIDIIQLENLLRQSTTLREPFNIPMGARSKDASWYGAYQAARRHGRISRSKLAALLRSTESGLISLEESLSRLKPDGRDILKHILFARIPQTLLARDLDLTRKTMVPRLLRNEKKTTNQAFSHVRKLTKIQIGIARSLQDQFSRLVSADLEFDRVRSVVARDYRGYIFDLTVPTHANFLAGKGAIIAHNTTTVQSITGVWASAHSEELKRGITIKVGYADAAFYKCSQNHGVSSYSTSPKCPIDGRKTTFLRAVSFVDTPGHESLMTNMLAGAFLMDGALLVIAANETVPKPQTREHLQALQMLGMKKIVIAQNKIDLVTDAEAKKNYSQIEKFVKGTVAEGAPIVPISAQQRLNIDALIEALEDVIPTPKRDSNAKPLMYVVRSFDVNRPGSEIQGLSGGVLGGSLTRGELKVGEEIEVRPGMVDERSGKFVPVITRISSLQTGAGAAEKVGPGGLVAVGTHLDPTYIKGDQMVGSVIGKPGALPETLEHVTLDVTLLETAVGSADLVKVDKVKLGETVRLNLGTASTLAVATSVRGSVVEVDLKKPVAIESGMRAAISRRIAERWRLIGSGVLK